MTKRCPIEYQIAINRHFHLSVDSDADTYADCFAYLFLAGSCPNYLRYLDHTVFKVVRRIFFFFFFFFFFIREKFSFV